MDLLKILLLPFLLCSCANTSYLVDAGIGQWKLFNRARPIQEILSNPNAAQATKEAILTVIDVKKFAVQELGLKATKNYKEFVQLDDDYVSWAVSAADPLVLKEKLWKFPIVGEVPYLGFFKKSQAKEFAKKMEEENPKPDIWIRGVPAFSSLGWFSDPLYSSMILDGEREIANIVIHESLHATIWLENGVEFNEKLANFVGLEGSVRYLAQKHPGGEEAAQARRWMAGEKIFGLFVRDALELYRAEVHDLRDKEKFYAQLSARYDAFFLSRAKKMEAEKLPVHFERWNNAALLAYSNYYSDYSVFEEMLSRCEKNLGRFVRWVASTGNAARGFDRVPEGACGD